MPGSPLPGESTYDNRRRSISSLGLVSNLQLPKSNGAIRTSEFDGNDLRHVAHVYRAVGNGTSSGSSTTQKEITSLLNTLIILSTDTNQRIRLTGGLNNQLIILSTDVVNKLKTITSLTNNLEILSIDSIRRNRLLSSAGNLEILSTDSVARKGALGALSNLEIISLLSLTSTIIKTIGGTANLEILSTDILRRLQSISFANSNLELISTARPARKGALGVTPNLEIFSTLALIPTVVKSISGNSTLVILSTGNVLRIRQSSFTGNLEIISNSGIGKKGSLSFQPNLEIISGLNLTQTNVKTVNFSNAVLRILATGSLLNKKLITFSPNLEIISTGRVAGSSIIRAFGDLVIISTAELEGTCIDVFSIYEFPLYIQRQLAAEQYIGRDIDFNLYRTNR